MGDCLQMAGVSLGTTRPPIFYWLIDGQGVYPALEKVWENFTWVFLNKIILNIGLLYRVKKDFF